MINISSFICVCDILWISLRKSFQLSYFFVKHLLFFSSKSFFNYQKCSQKDVQTTEEVIREYDVVDRAITDTNITTSYDETIVDNRKTLRDDRTTEETRIVEERRPRDGPKKPEKFVKTEQCICEICTCG